MPSIVPTTGTDASPIFGLTTLRHLGNESSGRHQVGRRSGVDEGPGGVEQPRQHVSQLRRVEPGGEIAFDVPDRTLEHVQPVAQRLELGSREHELVLTQAELCGSVASFVVPLTTTLTAVLTRAAP
jgi:hypothetical protein